MKDSPVKTGSAPNINAEERLRESEVRYRTLFNTIDEGFCIIEFFDGPHGPLSDYIHVEANPAYERHTGIPNVVGQKVREMVPNEADGWVALYRDVLVTGQPIRFERELIATARHLELSAFRVEPESRRQVAVLFQDVTARKRAEEALRENRERLQAALDGSGTGTFRWNIQTNALDWDENLDRLFGLPPGKTIRSLENFIAAVHPDDQPGVIERCKRCAEEGVDFSMEFRVVWRDGTIHWLDDQGKTFHDEKGRPTYMTGMCRDITRRKNDEQALRESEERFRTVADSAPVLIWQTDSTGVMVVNRHYLNFFGAAFQAVAAMRWSDFLHPEDYAAYVGAYRSAWDRQTAYEFQCRFRRHDGEYRWLHNVGSPHRAADGTFLGFAGSSSDVTDIKHAEQLIQSEAKRLEALVQQRTAKLQSAVGELEPSPTAWLTTCARHFALSVVMQRRCRRKPPFLQQATPTPHRTRRDAHGSLNAGSSRLQPVEPIRCSTSHSQPRQAHTRFGGGISEPRHASRAYHNSIAASARARARASVDAGAGKPVGKRLQVRQRRHKTQSDRPH
jgi:PAS domain S-box-containing protein